MRLITNTTVLNDLPTGAAVFIFNDGATYKYIKQGDGRFLQEGHSRGALPVSSFAGSIRDGVLYLPDGHTIWDVIAGSDGFYYKVIGKEGDQWVCARTDGSGAASRTERWVGDPLGSDFSSGNHTLIAPAFAFIETGEKLAALQAQMEQIMSTGVVPDEMDYLVSVTVVGKATVRPTVAQASRLIGNGVTVTSVPEIQVPYSKSIEVLKGSRWGCACEQVTAADLGAPGQVESWVVQGCHPNGGVSTVHAADEVTAEDSSEDSGVEVA